MCKTDLDLLNVRCKECETCEGCRTDCKALTGSCCCISESVEDVCTLTYLRVEFAHLGVTAGIVCDRAVSVSCESDTESREHTDSCDTDTVKTCTEAVGRE